MNEQDSVKDGGDRPELATADSRRDGDASATAAGSASLERMGQAISGSAARRPAPVELWNPPYCGDIGLAIARDGTWSYRGSPIRRLPLVKLFAGVLRCEANGCHFLVTPVEKVDVKVEDAPFIAVEMNVQGTGSTQTLVLRTNLDDMVTVDAAHPLRFDLAADGAMKPYVRVRGRLDALLTRSLTFDLAELMVSGPTGRTGVWSDGAFFPAI